ncbi:MAG: low-specificity L-threonine aldolase [Methylocystaceae bacterium]
MIDFRSDTVTEPTEEMREAMSKAAVGDDVYGDDPTINRLEEMTAAMVGKEAGLFVPSGTMGNLVALLTHTHPGEEIILGAESHIYYYEVGGLARLAGVLPRLFDDRSGSVNADMVKSMFRAPNLHLPETSLICLENTHNRGGGTIISPKTMQEIYELAQEHRLPVHLDGARIFNAAVGSNLPVTAFTRYADTVNVCLSKGLSAPVGSVLTGSRNFINLARRRRKLVGGGMRQAGIIAAAGIVALETMIDRLADDHRHARQLAEGLQGLPGIDLDMAGVQTNMVAFSISKPGFTSDTFLTELGKYNIQAGSPGVGRIRMVTNRHISDDDVTQTISAVGEILAG